MIQFLTSRWHWGERFCWVPAYTRCQVAEEINSVLNSWAGSWSWTCCEAKTGLRVRIRTSSATMYKEFILVLGAQGYSLQMLTLKHVKCFPKRLLYIRKKLSDFAFQGLFTFLGKYMNWTIYIYIYIYSDVMHCLLNSACLLTHWPLGHIQTFLHERKANILQQRQTLNFITVPGQVWEFHCIGCLPTCVRH